MLLISRTNLSGLLLFLLFLFIQIEQMMVRTFPEHDFSTAGTFVFPAGSASDMWYACVAMHTNTIFSIFITVFHGVNGLTG